MKFDYQSFNDHLNERYQNHYLEIQNFVRETPEIKMIRDAYTNNMIFQISGCRCIPHVINGQGWLGIQVTILARIWQDCQYEQMFEYIDAGMEKFCRKISSILESVLDFWIRYDSAWEKLQIDWRPNESIAEDYYI